MGRGASDVSPGRNFISQPTTMDSTYTSGDSDPPKMGGLGAPASARVECRVCGGFGTTARTTHGQLPLQSVYASGPYIDTDVDLPGFFPPPLFWLVEDLRWREVAAPRTRGIR